MKNCMYMIKILWYINNSWDTKHVTLLFLWVMTIKAGENNYIVSFSALPLIFLPCFLQKAVFYLYQTVIYVRSYLYLFSRHYYLPQIKSIAKLFIIILVSCFLAMAYIKIHWTNNRFKLNDKFVLNKT